MRLNILFIVVFLWGVIAYGSVSASDGSLPTSYVRTLDGDTVEVDIEIIPAPFNKIKIRIFGVDTPEKGWRGQCEKEKLAGKKATEFTTKLMESSTNKEFVFMKWDKFGGRILGDVITDKGSLRELLIKNGHARPYFGDKKKSWCE